MIPTYVFARDSRSPSDTSPNKLAGGVSAVTLVRGRFGCGYRGPICRSSSLHRSPASSPGCLHTVYPRSCPLGFVPGFATERPVFRHGTDRHRHLTTPPLSVGSPGAFSDLPEHYPQRVALVPATELSPTRPLPKPPITTPSPQPLPYPLLAHW